jgi:hypothetical protein
VVAKTLVREWLDVEGPLTDAMIVAGRTVIEALMAAEMGLTDAFWWHNEHGVWRLAVAFPDVDRFGPVVMYRELARIIDPIESCETLPRNTQMTVLDEADEMVRLVRLRAPSPGQHGTRVRHWTIDSCPIEDAFVYQVRSAGT